MPIGVDFTNAAIKAGVVSAGQVLHSNGRACVKNCVTMRSRRRFRRCRSWVSALGDSAGVIGAAHLATL